MALNSINTNIAAYYAQMNIGKASTSASSSIARLSSGNRIVRAADDVAAMSAGTSLRTNVTTLRMALINTSQGTSLLQVADGALSQITDILQRQKAIAVQASSGSLTGAERGFLNQEFQNLTSEIDRLVSQTNFNGVALLDGSLSERVGVEDVATAAAGATASVSFTVNAADGEVIVLNGVTVSMDTAATAGQVQIGSTLEESLDNLVTFLNASANTDLSQATYSRYGNTLQITSKAGGTQAQQYTLDLRNTVSTWTDNTDTALANGGSGGSFITAFKVGMGVANITDDAVGTAASATIPFQNGYTIKSLIGAAPAVTTIATMTTGESLQDIVNEINARTSFHGITARITGFSGNYNLQFSHSNPDLDNEGTATDGGDVTITLTGTGKDRANAALAATAAGNTSHVQIYSLSGGGATGLGYGDTVGRGTIGDSVIGDQQQERSKVSIIFPDITVANLVSTLAPTPTTAMNIQFGDPATAGEFVTFTFTANDADDAAPTEIAIGATLTETLDNAVKVINSYKGTGVENYDLNQVRAYRDGNSIVFETKFYGDTRHLDLGGATNQAVNITLGNPIAGSSATNGGNLDSGSRTGVGTEAVTNSAWIGNISGFTATYSGTTDTVDISITVGNHTYSATDVDTTPTGAANTTVRLSSADGGGYFDIDLRANSGTAVLGQSDADVYAQRLNAAFSSLTFYQTRDVSSYTGDAAIVTDGTVTGSLIGTKVRMQDTDFSEVKIDSISVEAPSGSSSNGKVIFTINGEEFTTASNVGNKFAANQTYRLTSASDSDRFIEFTTGDTDIEFDTDAKAQAFEDALKSAFGVGDGSSALSFQVGVTTSDTLEIAVDNVSTDKIFNGADLDVLTQANAAVASDAIDAAIDMITSVRADVGALQSRFGYAAANVESSIQNQDAARGVLLDTDVAAESTAYATAQVQLQAGIAVLAQANLLPQNLLKLIG